MSKVSRGKEGELQVINILNKLNDYNCLLNDLIFINNKSKMTHQIDHILIRNNGIFVIETKNYYGKIIYNKDKNEWHIMKNNELLRIVNPIRQNKSHEICIYKILKGKYKIISLVVFVKNNAPKESQGINIDNLYNYILNFECDYQLDEIEINNIKNIILSSRSKISNEEHVNNIYNQRGAKDPVKKFCPICKSRLLEYNNIFHCFKCQKDFKKY